MLGRPTYLLRAADEILEGNKPLHVAFMRYLFLFLNYPPLECLVISHIPYPPRGKLIYAQRT